MEGPTKLRGVGADFTARAKSLAQPNTSLKTHSVIQTSTLSPRVGIGQFQTRTEATTDWFRSRAANFVTWSGDSLVRCLQRH
jgi:hypothetical protein